jgi:asparagine synthetase B (glutamine-hydrolysing)
VCFKENVYPWTIQFNVMCGIYVTVAQDLVEFGRDDNVVDSSLQPPPEWLLRRGPDDCNHQVVRCYFQNETTNNDSATQVIVDATVASSEAATTTTTVTKRPTDVVRVTMYASVLKMRSSYIQQPVNLFCNKVNHHLLPLQRPPNNPSTDEKINDDASFIESNFSQSVSIGNAYLAWNGEVYEIFNDLTDCIEPVYCPTIADTVLVRNLIADQVNFGDDHTTIPQQQQQIANVMGQLINAEYSFCIVTSECIFYGRDIFGRRSLLTGTSTTACSDSSFQLSRTRNGTHKTNETDPDIQWYLASVAAPSSSSSPNDIAWEEVVPGLVHAYVLNPKFDNLLSVLKPIRVQIPRIEWPHPPVTKCAQSLPSQITSATLQSSGNTIDRCSDLMEPVCQQFYDVLLEAVRRRCGRTSDDPKDGYIAPETAVLFSGGLDSSVVAALALVAGVSSLTLLTVSFVDHHEPDHQSNDQCDANATTRNTVVAADAVAAKQSYDELCQLFPNATINFVHRIVDWNDVLSAEACVRKLAFPKTASVMDVNIATALWFAASASDNTFQNDSDHSTMARPRVLLSGLGADELLGGYGRHRTAWNRGGFEELQNELNIDLNRLWERNLGRDDRVLSDTGKEVRFPFLDINVVQFVQQLPLQYVVDYSLDAGIGDKRILRLLAQQIGLTTASTAIKRAIQFGSRISHVSDKRRFGSRRKANLSGTKWNGVNI